MAHFCKLDFENIVEFTIVVDNHILLDENQQESEMLGIQYLKSIYGQNTNWKQTSYHGNFRNLFAGPGFKYDSEKDIFIFPQPYPSWIFNEEKQDWDPPVPFPEGLEVYWDEQTQNWVLF
jgi:hypothetical protein